MREEIQARCVMLGKYMLKTGATVRKTAEVFRMSKSSVHKDVHERLRSIHPGLYTEVEEILKYHHDVRHIRGGAATRRRWRLIREGMRKTEIPRNDQGDSVAERQSLR